MFLPIGDTPNPENFRPIVNWLLIGLNVAIYLLITLPLSQQGVSPDDPVLADYLRVLLGSGVTTSDLLASLEQLSSYDLYIFVHGYKPGAPQISDLFFSMFLHGGVLHLAGNMLFLWIFGDNIEHRLGRITYLLVYLSTGAVATISFAVFNSGSMVPLVGASGAISGVLGLYFILFRRNRVKVFVFFFPFIMNVILLPARLVLGFYIIVDNLLPVLVGVQSGVAYGAHIGGFVAGLGCALLGERFNWRLPRREKLFAGSHLNIVEENIPTSGSTPFQQLRAAISERSRSDALAVIALVNPGHLSQLLPEECVILADWLDRAGHHLTAARILRQCLRHHQHAEAPSQIYLALGLLRLRQGQATAAYQHLLSALEANPSADVAHQAREAISRIQIYQPGPKH